MVKRDKIHYSFNRIDGYNKAFNYVVSSRETGKSVAWVLDKAYKKFKKSGKTALVIRRRTVDITEAYILSIQFIINKFADEKARFSFQKSALHDGVVYINLDGKPFLGIVALSIDINRIKSLILPNVDTVIFDEFIINPRYGEKYLKNEVEKFKEVYNTFRRECDGLLKCYFCGNPYTRYNPYFLDTGAPLDRILPDTIFAGENWVIESYKMHPNLYEKIKKENPLYKPDDVYTNYALNGESVNDSNIKIIKPKNNFKLFLLCNVYNQTIGIFKNPAPMGDEIRFYCRPCEYNNTKKTYYTLNLTTC